MPQSGIRNSQRCVVLVLCSSDPLRLHRFSPAAWQPGSAGLFDIEPDATRFYGAPLFDRTRLTHFSEPVETLAASDPPALGVPIRRCSVSDELVIELTTEYNGTPGFLPPEGLTVPALRC